MTNRSRSLTPAQTDVLLAVATFAITALSIAAGRLAPDDIEPNLGAYALAAFIAALLLVRRRWPVAVLVISTLTVVGYFALSFPAIDYGLPLAAALYTCAAAGRTTSAIVDSLALLTFASTTRIVFFDQDPLDVLLQDTLPHGALMLGAIGLGYAVRSREQLQQQERRAAEERARTAERDAEARIEEERLLLARDLHDVLAHTVSVMSIQADVAGEALDDGDQQQARRSIALIRQQCTSASAELRGTLSLMRGETRRTPFEDLGDLRSLIDRSVPAGITADLSTSGDLEDLRLPVRATAFRVVQEALTNAVKHAGARHIEIAVRRDASALEVEVNDDGRGGLPNSGGHGLQGIRERVALVGGDTQIGPRPGRRGFGVRARIPL